MPTTEMLVEALIEMRAHPEEARQQHFWQLAERFRADLINQAFRLLGNQTDAEDVAQDALCRAYVDLHTLKDPLKLGAWLRSINRFVALQLLRRRRAMREERLKTGEMVTLTKTRFPNRRATPEDGWQLDDRHARMVAAVDALPEAYREVIVLHYWEKLTLAQVAERLAVPPGTVRSRAARADDMLLKKLRAMEKAEEHPK